MYNQISKLGFVLALAFSTNSVAQIATTPPESATAVVGFSADIGNLFEKGKVANFTDKYNGYVSSKIFFNLNKVKILVFKSAANDCGLEVCPALAEKPLEVELDVKKVEYQGCFVSYYAKTPDYIKATYQEKVIIRRFASERCQSIAEIPEGTIHYKIEGVGSGDADSDTAHVFSYLRNVKKIEISK